MVCCKASLAAAVSRPRVPALREKAGDWGIGNTLGWEKANMAGGVPFALVVCVSTGAAGFSRNSSFGKQKVCQNILLI
jgi:hypothetical protein